MSYYTIEGERDAAEAIERLCSQWNGGLSAEDEGAPHWACVVIPRNDIEALKALLGREGGFPSSVSGWFWGLLEAICDQFDLGLDEAMRFVGESIRAGGLPNPEEEAELVEELREVARHEADEKTDSGSYWREAEEDPMNGCPERGEYPHAECEIDGLYEGSSSWYSILFAACHRHRTYWHLQSGGTADPNIPKLAELGEGYRHVTGDGADD